jgi:hypothetical protein
MFQEYAHQALHQEITAAAGHFVLVKEVRLPFQGREILYLVGHAAFDTTCCGAGGCAYALVPGFILVWKGQTNRDGLAVSRVEPIHARDVQKQVQESIERRDLVHQVIFL